MLDFANPREGKVDGDLKDNKCPFWQYPFAVRNQHRQVPQIVGYKDIIGTAEAHLSDSDRKEQDVSFEDHINDVLNLQTTFRRKLCWFQPAIACSAGL